MNTNNTNSSSNFQEVIYSVDPSKFLKYFRTSCHDNMIQHGIFNFHRMLA